MAPVPHTAQYRFPKAVRRGAILGLSVLIFCLSLFLLELGLRWIGLGEPVLYRTSASYRYAPAPHQRKQRIRGATVTIDSHGLRTIQDWEQADSMKLLFVGDSVTWAGTSIDDKDTFSHLTGLEVARRTGRPVVTGNAGVNGYGTDNMTARLKYQTFGEDILVLVLISGDTIRGLADIKSSYFFTRSPPQPFPALWEFLTFSFWNLSAQMRSAPATVDPDWEAAATESLGRLFTILHAKQAKGISVLLVLSPYEDELVARPGALTLHVRRMLKDSGFRFLDLYSQFSGPGASDLYSDGVHLNERGHALYADAIAGAITDIALNFPDPMVTSQR